MASSMIFADLMIIDAALDGGDERDIETDRREPIEASSFSSRMSGLAANDAIGLAVEAVELEVDRRADLGELFEEAVVVRDALAVGVHHDEWECRGRARIHKVDDLRMDGGLAAGELHHFGVPFGTDKVVQHRFDFFQRQTEAGTRIGKAERAVHVAGAVDLDDAQAGVLLMVGAQAAIVRTAVFDLAP